MVTLQSDRDKEVIKWIAFFTNQVGKPYIFRNTSLKIYDY